MNTLYKNISLWALTQKCAYTSRLMDRQIDKQTFIPVNTLFIVHI